MRLLLCPPACLQLGIVNRDQADVMLRFTPLTRPSTLEHRAARSQGVSEVVKLLKGLQSLQGKVPDNTARRNRWVCCSDRGNRSLPACATCRCWQPGSAPASAHRSWPGAALLPALRACLPACRWTAAQGLRGSLAKLCGIMRKEATVGGCAGGWVGARVGGWVDGWGLSAAAHEWQPAQQLMIGGGLATAFHADGASLLSRLPRLPLPAGCA